MTTQPLSYELIESQLHKALANQWTDEAAILERMLREHPDHIEPN